MTKETPENTHSSAEELSALLRDVEKHNKQFSLGSMMAKVIFDSVRESIDDRVDKDRKSTRLNSSHIQKSRMPSSA